MKIRRTLFYTFAATSLFLLLIAKGCIVFDHSAQRRGEGVYWNGVLYVPCSGEYTEGKTIAKTEDRWQINEAVEDKSHTFIVLRSFLDQYLLVREDYAIPSNGEITSLCWNGKYINDETFISSVVVILRDAKPTFEYETDGIFQLKNGQKMRPLIAAYSNCPIATEHIGYMGNVNGTWCITLDHPPKTYGKVSCYAIPPEYTDILDRFIS